MFRCLYGLLSFLFDALTTYLVWLRTAHFAGFFSEAQYAQEQDFVRNLIKEKTQEPGYDHLKTYLDEWDRLQALTNRLVHNSTAAGD